MASLVAEGAVGAPTLIRSSFGFRLDDPTDVRLDPGLEGGALMDVGCYCVSASRLLAAPSPSRPTRSRGGPTATASTCVWRARCGSPTASWPSSTASSTRRRVAASRCPARGHARRSRPVGRRQARAAAARSGGGLPRARGRRLRAPARQPGGRASGAAPALLGRDDAVGQARAIEASTGPRQRGRPSRSDYSKRSKSPSSTRSSRPVRQPRTASLTSGEGARGSAGRPSPRRGRRPRPPRPRLGRRAPRRGAARPAAARPRRAP
jgi:hypothetical protein